MFLVPDCSYRKEQYRYKQFVKTIRKLPYKNINSIPEATLITLDYMKGNENQVLCNKAFTEYRRVYYKILRNSSLSYNGYIINECSMLPLESIKKYQKYFKSVGLNLLKMEGCYYLEEDNNFTLKFFYEYLDEPWIQYLMLRDKENNIFLNDGAVVISWEELRQRIIFWERFLEKYPDFPENNEVKAKLHSYFTWYLWGKYIYAYSNDRFSKELRISYENFLSNNQLSVFYPLIKDWYNLLKENNFRYLPNHHKELEKTLKRFPYKYNSRYNKDIFNGISP